MTIISQSHPDIAVLDPRTLHELWELADDGDPSFILELFQSFLVSAQEGAEAIQHAIEAGDADSLRRCAHGLKGASSNVGAVELARMCLTLEAAARDNRLDIAAEALDPLLTEIQRVRQAMAEELPDTTLA